MTGELDVLVPTRNRPTELAVTLAGLAASPASFGVIVSDQSDGPPPWDQPAVATTIRILRHHNRQVTLHRHPRRGLAEHRAFLLDRSRARYVLFLDDDVWLSTGAIPRLLTAIRELKCGFVGNAVHGLSYTDDHRPEQESFYEEWHRRPTPEVIEPNTTEWRRSEVHSAANLLHVTERLDLGPDEWRAYKVAWIGGCVLYDRAKLNAAGGFDFWPDMPLHHAGEDVAAQLAVMSRYGGAGIVPSGAYHLEAPTTVPPAERAVECWALVSRSSAPATTASTGMLSTNDTR